jgi:hypothetical protein
MAYYYGAFQMAYQPNQSALYRVASLTCPLHTSSLTSLISHLSKSVVDRLSHLSQLTIISLGHV